MSLEIDNSDILYYGRFFLHVMPVTGWRVNGPTIDAMEARVTMPAKTAGFRKSFGFGWHLILDTREDANVPFHYIWTYCNKVNPEVGLALQEILERENQMDEAAEIKSYQQLYARGLNPGPPRIT